MKEEKLKIQLLELKQYLELLKYLRKICKHDAYLIIQVINSKCYTQFAYDKRLSSLKWEFPSLKEFNEKKKQKLLNKGFIPPSCTIPKGVKDFTEYDYGGNPNYHKEIKFKNNDEELLNGELVRIIKESIEIFMDIYEEKLPLELEIELFE